jgi:hypothetical protein
MYGRNSNNPRCIGTVLVGGMGNVSAEAWALYLPGGEDYTRWGVGTVPAGWWGLHSSGLGNMNDVGEEKVTVEGRTLPTGKIGDCTLLDVRDCTRREWRLYPPWGGECTHFGVRTVSTVWGCEL